MIDQPDERGRVSIQSVGASKPLGIFLIKWCEWRESLWSVLDHSFSSLRYLTFSSPLPAVVISIALSCPPFSTPLDIANGKEEWVKMNLTA